MIVRVFPSSFRMTFLLSAKHETTLEWASSEWGSTLLRFRTFHCSLASGLRRSGTNQSKEVPLRRNHDVTDDRCPV